MENKGKFEFTYSAAQQEEIKSIREKYIEKKEDKMETLRNLDRSATKKGTAVSLAVGIIGALLLGIGMSLTMTDASQKWFIPGVAVGVIGIAVVASAYPLYVKINKREREKIAPEILRLTDELMK